MSLLCYVFAILYLFFNFIFFILINQRSLSDQLRDQKASKLSAQLRSDGIERMTEEHVLQNYQFWGYNPPFTLPIFRRNEIWLDLTEDEVNILEEKVKDGEQ